jgi:hypothetical protein
MGWVYKSFKEYINNPKNKTRILEIIENASKDLKTKPKLVNEKFNNKSKELEKIEEKGYWQKDCEIDFALMFNDCTPKEMLEKVTELYVYLVENYGEDCKIKKKIRKYDDGYYFCGYEVFVKE